MLKKIGFVTAGAAAGLMMMSGLASAQGDVDQRGGGGEDDGYGQVGLVNLNNTDILHNTNLNLGVCDNNINVLGVQVVVEDSLNGVAIPVLSPGENETAGATSHNCATAEIEDGGSIQDN